MVGPEFTPPIVQGREDPAPGTPPTAGELRIADGGRTPETARLEQINAGIEAEPQTEAQKAEAIARIQELAGRYGSGRRDAT